MPEICDKKSSCSKMLKMLNKLEPGVLISNIENRTYTLYIYLGKNFMKLFKMILN